MSNHTLYGFRIAILMLCGLTVRATHQSLGTVIFASAVSSLATSLTTLLKKLQMSLRSKHIHPLLQPLTYLVPLFGVMASSISIFNGYALVYAGMTGDNYVQSGKTVASMLRSNKTINLGDSELPLRILEARGTFATTGRLSRAKRDSSLTRAGLLVRMVLFVTSVAWGLFAGLIAFLLSSARLESGSRLPASVAMLSFFVPLWTMKLCQDVCGDA